MRQAITTKYLGPTNSRGSRVKARCQAKSLTVPWDHALDPTENHKAAARMLQEQLQWSGQLVGGWDHEEKGVFVIVDTNFTEAF